MAVIWAGMGGLPAAAATVVPSHGRETWATRYNGPASNEDVPAAVVPSPDGQRVYVTGLSEGVSSASDYATVAYEAATGSELWTSRYDGPNHHAEYASALAVSADGSTVVMTGESYNSPDDSDYATVAMDAASGSIRWTARYDGPAHGHDHANSLVVTPDGSEVVVTGYSDGGASSDDDYATVAYRADSGTELWTSRFNGPVNGSDIGVAVSMSPDGQKAFVTGHAYVHDNGDFVTLALATSTGSLLWESVFAATGTSDDFPTDLGVSPDGSTVFVVGDSQLPPYGPSNYATVAIDAASGNRLWARRYNAARGHRDYAGDLVVSPDGSSIYVTGYAVSGSRSEFATVAFGAQTGSSLWVARFGSPDYITAQGYAEALSPDGKRLYVTGLVTGGFSDGYATLSYEPLTGELVGERFYGEPERLDYPSDVAVTSTMVFVTGKVATGVDGWDYGTVAYAAG